MVGPRDVIANRLGRVAAEKDGPGMMDPLGQRVSLVERHIEFVRALHRVGVAFTVAVAANRI